MADRRQAEKEVKLLGKAEPAPERLAKLPPANLGSEVVLQIAAKVVGQIAAAGAGAGSGGRTNLEGAVGSEKGKGM